MLMSAGTRSCRHAAGRDVRQSPRLAPAGGRAILQRDHIPPSPCGTLSRGDYVVKPLRAALLRDENLFRRR